MNEREELLKKLNEDFEEKNNVEVTPYKATTNLNTSLSNPNVNLNNNTNININDNSGVDSSMSIDNLMKENVQPTPAVEEKIAQAPTPAPIPAEEIPQTPPVNQDQNLDVTEKFYEEQPIYDMQTNYTQTYISNQDIVEKPKNKIKISKDTQILIIAIIIIFIFILILPVVSDTINNIKNG